jgi:hypothetical protein
VFLTELAQKTGKAGKKRLLEVLLQGQGGQLGVRARPELQEALGFVPSTMGKKSFKKGMGFGEKS